MVESLPGSFQVLSRFLKRSHLSIKSFQHSLMPRSTQALTNVAGNPAG
jgi:hypothetical protein